MWTDPWKTRSTRLPTSGVFGKKVKAKDVYIKISLGFTDSSAVCISFHIAEYKLVYKFK